MTASGQWWLVPAIAAGALTFVALGIGVWQLLCGRNIEAANWVMAAGGLGLIVFSSVQLHREARREAERLAAARAKLKPVAWLARRMCEQAVIESGDRTMNQWLARWYTRVVSYMMQGDRPPDPLSVLQDLLRETVTLAAEAGDKDVKAADAAFDAFIAAANVTNHLQGTLGGGADTTVYQAAIPRGRRAAQHLAMAAHALERLAPRGAEEPAVPVDPKFTDEK
jgi:hypothetical protein